MKAQGGQLLKPITAATGYSVINCTKPDGSRKQVALHRAVLLAFAGVPPKGMQACHMNGVRSDNRLENLRWDSVKGNHADKKEHGTWQGGEKNGNALLTAEAVSYIRSSCKPLALIAKELGVSLGCISKAKYRQTWRHVA